ncbi:hypothetical protein EWM64_g476 [Hericium alpestre]|uniref:Uncharacterized protein n=1 Tax=Hericium alpestre TaxID=135208 RepID=A0A4Z0ABX3_9AGAM|nr:hypothetical protein EWM64_g476 [Hericium alpestre]
MPRKPEVLPPSMFAEPSEPGDHKPSDNPRAQEAGQQEENPQAVLKVAGEDRPESQGAGKERAPTKGKAKL